MNQKGFVPILIIFLVLAAIGGAYYFGTLKSGKQIFPSPTPQNSPLTDSTPSALPTPNQTEDPTAKWNTYTTKDNKFTFKYPSDWTLKDGSGDTDLYNDGKMVFQKDITISNGEYIFRSYDPLAWGPAACLFSDSPKFEGPSSEYDNYVEMKMGDTLLRRAKADPRPDVLPEYTIWAVCSKEETSNYFVSVAWFGATHYQTPLNYDQDKLKIMDEILSSLRTVK
jgi:hypothetical protein